MESKTIDNEDFLPCSAVKSFLTSLLSEIFVLAIAIVSYFAIFYNIENVTLKEKRTIREESYNVIYTLSRESGLYHSNKSNTTQFTISNYYEYFVGSFLYYDYKSDVYDYEKDPDGFKKKEQAFKDDIKLLTIHDGFVDDDFIGRFYTKYILDKVDVNDEKIVAYSKEESIAYYINSVLKAKDSESGAIFFDYKNDEEIPHLKSEIRTLLFGYVVNQIISDKAAEVDKQFYNYFLTIFTTASDLLMEDKVYLEAYNAFETSNEQIISVQINSVVWCTFIGILLIFAVLPLFNRKHRLLPQYITRTVMIGRNDKIEWWQYFGQIIAGILKHFNVAIIISLICDFRTMTTPLFSIGVVAGTLLLFACISLIIDVVSIVISVLNPEHRNVDALISKANLCTISRRFVGSKPSDTVSE